jgi:hypothetical protein
MRPHGSLFFGLWRAPSKRLHFLSLHPGVAVLNFFRWPPSTKLQPLERPSRTPDKRR